MGDAAVDAEQESVVLTVRWPSVPGYAVPDPAVAADRAGADSAGPAEAH